MKNKSVTIVTIGLIPNKTKYIIYKTKCFLDSIFGPTGEFEITDEFNKPLSCLENYIVEEGLRCGCYKTINKYKF